MGSVKEILITFHISSFRKYQILDFRINQTFKNKVIPKRSYSKYNQPHKFTSAMKIKTSTIRQMAPAAAEPKATEETRSDDVYIYRPGVIPPCRQMFYQVKNLFPTLSLRDFNWSSFSTVTYTYLKSKNFWHRRIQMKFATSVTVGSLLKSKMNAEEY